MYALCSETVRVQSSVLRHAMLRKASETRLWHTCEGFEGYIEVLRSLVLVPIR